MSESEIHQRFHTFFLKSGCWCIVFKRLSMSYIQDSNPKLPANDWFTPGIKKKETHSWPQRAAKLVVSLHIGSLSQHQWYRLQDTSIPIKSTEVFFADVQFNICPTKILLVLAGSPNLIQSVPVPHRRSYRPLSAAAGFCLLPLGSYLQPGQALRQSAEARIGHSWSLLMSWPVKWGM